MATIRVHTTQNVTLEYEVGSIGDRIVATLLDYLVLGAWGTLWALLFTYGLASGGSRSGGGSDHSAWYSLGNILGILLVATIVAPFLFYNLACEVFFNGQSLGKKARDLRVVRLDGTAPRLGDYFLRWLLRLVDMGIGSGLIAVITIAANGKGQRLGDLAAGTAVVSTKPRAESLQQVISPLMPTGYQPVFPQASTLSDHDVTLLRQLLGRSLQQDNHLLLNATAVKIKQLLKVESGMSDEAFLRTVLRDQAYLATQE